MNRGYIALWRKIEDNPLYTEERSFSKFEAWIDILINVTAKRDGIERLICNHIYKSNYGELIRSISTMGKHWKWSKNKVVRFLEQLKKMNQIEYTSDTRTTIIKVLNFGRFDPSMRNQTFESETELRCTGEPYRPPINKHDKHEKHDIKKEKKSNDFFKKKNFDGTDGQEIRQAFDEKKPKPKTRVVGLPKDFALDEKKTEYAKSKGLCDFDVKAEFEKFQNYHEAKGSKFKNWDFAWRTWVLNCLKFREKGETENKKGYIKW